MTRKQDLILRFTPKIKRNYLSILNNFFSKEITPNSLTSVFRRSSAYHQQIFVNALTKMNIIIKKRIKLKFNSYTYVPNYHKTVNEELIIKIVIVMVDIMLANDSNVPTNNTSITKEPLPITLDKIPTDLLLTELSSRGYKGELSRIHKVIV